MTRDKAAVEPVKAEESLQNGEVSMSAIFAQAAVGLSELSLEGQFKRVNDNLCNLLARTRDQLLTMNAADVTHPEDVPRTRNVLTKLIENGISSSLDKRYVRPNGDLVFANSAVTRLDDDQGRPRSILVVTVDLTQRFKAEAALATELADNKRLQDISIQLVRSGGTQALYKKLIKAAVEIAHADTGAIHLFYPEERQLKLLATHKIARPLRSVCAEEKHDAQTSCAEAMREKRRIIVTDYQTDPRFSGSEEARQYLKAGVRAAQSMPLVSRSGRLLGMVAIHWAKPHEPEERQLRLLDILGRQAADLIDRDQSDAALRESEARYRILFDSIDEGFCVIQMKFDDNNRPSDFKYLKMNPAFEKQSGLRNVIGKWHRTLEPETEQSWYETLGEIALTGKPKRFVNPASHIGRWFDVYGFQFGDPKKRQVAALFSDITHRIQVEDELKQADRRKNEFLAVLAHELRNPLAPIRAGLEVVRMSQGNRQTADSMLVLMHRQMTHLVRLVDDLLDLSRISQDKMRINKEPCILQDILGNAVGSSEPSIELNHITLTCDFPSTPIMIEADGVRLAQVFSNLLTNAAKYTPAGGRVDFVVEAVGSSITARVRDSGMGIPKHMLRNVFKAFTQVDSSLCRSQGGLGIGLSLVKTLVALHGGRVEAHSDGPDRGSEFVVKLPDIICSAQAIEPTQAPTTEGNSTPHRILVVDDNIDAADTLAIMLRMAGDEVQVAHSGTEGLSIAEKTHPELLLLDLGMPGLDGYEVARRIRAKSWGQSVVISALTGWGQEEDRQRSSAAGFDYHLVKPVGLDTLRGMLNSLPGH